MRRCNFIAKSADAGFSEIKEFTDWSYSGNYNGVFKSDTEEIIDILMGGRTFLQHALNTYEVDLKELTIHLIFPNFFRIREREMEK